MAFQPKVGEILLNKYETISPLGDGAFGSVWRARDIKLDRIVAVKFINTTSGVLSRFSDELEAIKNLDHPNIVRLYDFDILRGGVPCIVMELVNGREIGDILMSDGPFSGPRLCNIILQVVDALVETHKHNIVHCDLKPENIMLMNVGAREDVVKLIDFGVASIMSKDSSNDADKKKMLVGTPQYMAPEQIRHEELGPWTDIYALGLIMIELFTGQFVFDHDDPREVLRMQLHNPVTIPHKLACTPLGPIIARAVEKEVSKRYQSTQEFYEELRAANRMMQTMVIEQPLRTRFDSTMFKRMSPAELGDDEEDDFLSDLDDFDSMVNGGGKSKSIPELGHTQAGSDSSVPLLDASSISKTNLKAVPGKNVPLMSASKSSTTGSGRVMIESQHSQESSFNQDFNIGDSLQTALGGLQDACMSFTEKAKIDINQDLWAGGSVAIQLPVKDEPKTQNADLSSNAAQPAKVLNKPLEKRSFVKPTLILIAVLLLIGGAGYVWTSGLLEEKGIIKAEPEPAPVPSKAEAAAAAQADIPDKPNVVTFATIKTMATQMAYVAAYSGQLGKSTISLKDVTPYRIIGTPTSANVYVNNSLVCAESPCILNIFGDPSKIQVEIREGQQSQMMVLGKHDPRKPIFISLKK